MTASKQARPFDIWLVYLHFTDHPQTGKVRPVLVVGVKEALIKVAKITSKPPQLDTSDVAITQWQQAGLNVPSTVRLSLDFEINPSELLRDGPIGHLQPFDVSQITQMMVSLGRFQRPEQPEQ